MVVEKSPLSDQIPPPQLDWGGGPRRSSAWDRRGAFEKAVPYNFALTPSDCIVLLLSVSHPISRNQATVSLSPSLTSG